MPMKFGFFFVFVLSFCKMAISNKVNFYPILDEYWTIVLCFLFFYDTYVHVSAVMLKVQFTHMAKQKVFFSRCLSRILYSVWLLYWIVMHFFVFLCHYSQHASHTIEKVFYDLFSVWNPFISRSQMAFNTFSTNCSMQFPHSTEYSR